MTQVFDKQELTDYIEGLGFSGVTDHGWEWAENLFYQGYDYRQISGKLLAQDFIEE